MATGMMPAAVFHPLHPLEGGIQIIPVPGPAKEFQEKKYRPANPRINTFRFLPGDPAVHGHIHGFPVHAPILTKGPGQQFIADPPGFI
jgi:hypothetical protein